MYRKYIKTRDIRELVIEGCIEIKQPEEYLTRNAQVYI